MAKSSRVVLFEQIRRARRVEPEVSVREGLDELIVNTIHDPRGVASTRRLHACASGVVVGGSHSDR